MFADYLRAGKEGQPRDVPARPHQAGDEAYPDRIGHCHHDDGDRLSRVLRYQGRLVS